ncbi:MAG: YqgE/AlgH family protein [Pseudomonadota bacterium]
MIKTVSLTNHFLIAMPGLTDPNFFQSVTYICEHNSEGAMGIVINRPLELTLREVLESMTIPVPEQGFNDVAIYLGGPVEPERGFVLHRPAGQWESSIPIAEDMALTTSRDIVAAIAEGSGPKHFLIALGYAGWGAGQLEDELANNAWLSVPADFDRLLDTPVELRWETAAALLGVDLKTLSSDIGHA